MNLTLWWVKPALYLILLAVIGGGFAAFVHHEREIGVANGQAETKKAYDRGVQETADAAAKLHAEKETLTEKSHEEDLDRQAKQVADGLVARTELQRLRDRLSRPSAAAASSPDQAGPVADGPTVEGRLLGECSSRYEEVAGDAGRLAVQVIGLQGFILANGIEGVSKVVAESPRVEIIGSAIQATTGSPSQAPGEVTPP